MYLNKIKFYITHYFEKAKAVYLTSVLVMGVTLTFMTWVLGEEGRVLVELDGSDQPLGPISFTAWIRNLKRYDMMYNVIE